MSRIPALLVVAAVVSLLACTSGTRRTGMQLPSEPHLMTQTPHTPRAMTPLPEDPSVAFDIAFRTGSQDDPPNKEGLAYLTATLMAEGATVAHSYPDILRLLYPMASRYDVRIDKEMVAFTGRTHRDNVDAYTGLLLDAILRPAFNEADFERIKERTLATIEKTLRYSSDEELGKAALYGAVFAGTPYGHLEEGTVAGLHAITLDDVKRFYSGHFTAGNVILGMGGGYDEALADRVDAALREGLSAGPPPPAPPIVPRPLEGRHVLIVEKPGPATAISIGFPIAAHRGERDFYALWLANSWLGEHRNSASHLYQVIREERGLNYGDYSYIEWFPEGGRRGVPPPNVPRRRQLFEIWIRPVPNATAHFALRAAVRELEQLVDTGLTQEQFDLTKQFLLKYSAHYAATTAAKLGYAVDDTFYGIPAPGHLARFREVIASLSRDEVNAAIRRYLDPGNMMIAIVTADGDSLAAALASEVPSPITYSTPKPAEVLAEDEVIRSYPLHIDRANIHIVPVDEMFVR